MKTALSAVSIDSVTLMRMLEDSLRRRKRSSILYNILYKNAKKIEIGNVPSSRSSASISIRDESQEIPSVRYAARNDDFFDSF
ncbi:MAG TPA: hypothetical protein DCR44_03625 [Acholeplasmatales bacterium]|nr:MAG: hypothetical protein A2Y16_01260 [Tenericutes bacterium GWF2_57_13]HAQ56474.1 hypothetical protein [Acholeplasmatales bacterium]